MRIACDCLRIACFQLASRPMANAKKPAKKPAKKTETEITREESLQLRVTKAEKAKIESAAKKVGLRAADWMRMVLLERAARNY